FVSSTATYSTVFSTLSLHDALPIYFVRDYVSLIGTIDYGRVDAHLFPQTWHLLPITYNKVIALEDVYFEMLNLLPKGICDQVFKDRKSTRLNSSHVKISYAVFCLKK